jgi:transcriptional regulator with XRE-family HTH domain
MTLDTYFDSGAMTPAELARKTGLSAASIGRILFGEQQASHSAIKAIVDATGGKVTAHDLIFGAPRDASRKREMSRPTQQDAAA